LLPKPKTPSYESLNNLKIMSISQFKKKLRIAAPHT